MDVVFGEGFYPAVKAFDRGSTQLPPFDRSTLGNCAVDLDAAETVVDWAGNQAPGCNNDASCQLVQYLLAAEAGGKRKTLTAGTTFQLDNSLTFETIIVNATDRAGNTVPVSGCGANDNSVGLLVTFGDSKYLIAGDLTGRSGHANAEGLLIDEPDLADVDVYQVNHHGGETSSRVDFMRHIAPTVAIFSQGTLQRASSRDRCQRDPERPQLSEAGDLLAEQEP